MIEVRKAPSLPWKQTVQVDADKPTKVRAELQATMHGGVGVVRVLSDAQGARAFIDGTDMGPVPVDIKDVKAGEHIIQVKAPGMQTGESTVTVAAGKSQIVKFDLNPETPADSGTLKVVSMVPEAEVFIDGAARRQGARREEAVGRRAPGRRAARRLQAVRAEGARRGGPDGHGARRRSSRSAGSASCRRRAAPTVIDQRLCPPARRRSITRSRSARRSSASRWPGFQAFEQTLTIEGGKTQTHLARARGRRPERGRARGTSSAACRRSARARCRAAARRSTSTPAIRTTSTARINVGAGKIAKKFGFDAGVGVRTMLARNELGLGGRAMLADAEPFSAGVFTDLWWGSKLLDDSQRNGFTWDVGALASLTALSQRHDQRPRLR